MSIAQKKKQVLSLISRMDETHLDALLVLLHEPLGGEYELSENEWAETERRSREVKKGKVKVKMVPAKNAARRIESLLRKTRS